MKRCATWLALLLSIATAQHSAHAFNPRGRKAKSTKPTPKKPAVRSKAPAVPAADGSAPSANGQEAARTEALIKRYSALVISQPGVQFPVQRLAQLYRERDGNTDALIAEFEQRAKDPGPAQFATLVALGGIYEQALRTRDAEAQYRRAIELSPKAAPALLALARLLEQRREVAEAAQLYERALPELKADVDVEQTLRVLMKLQLDNGQLELAKAHHRKLVQRARGSAFVEAELGRELMTRHRYAAAEVEFRDLVKRMAGDPRALGPALADLGRALLHQSKYDEARTVLEKALRTTPEGSGQRREILLELVTVHRGQDKLPELVSKLEKDGGATFERLRLLAELYEETGRIADAVATYKRALAVRSDAVDTRLRLVQLLQVQGQLEEVIVEYQALVKSSPHNSDLVFRLVEALLQRGQRPEALRTLAELSKRSAADEQTLAALVDFYERIGEAELAKRLLQRLASTRGSDPEHVVELGSRHFREGNSELARTTWKRLLQLIPNRAEALHRLGNVYLDHDMDALALEALREAAEREPDNSRYARALALALERSAMGAPKSVRQERYRQARQIWQALLDKPGVPARQEREAMQHIVTLWSLSGTLSGRIKPLRQKFESSPPDLSAGRLLAELLIRMRSHASAEQILLRVAELARADKETLARLERVQVLQNKLPDAITTLKRLVEVDPTHARDYYQRMAQYAAELYQDEEAIRYASRAVELSPQDASGHNKLAEMYRQRQDTTRAIAEYRRALAINDRLFPAYFALAELLIQTGRPQEADQLLRRVMRAAPDDQLVSRATRLSLQLNTGPENLESLEKELLPLALANPQRPVFRRLLVELYGTMAYPLAEEAKGTDPVRAQAAKERLRRISQRAVKPLLDTLGDAQGRQQSVALELLTLLKHRGATAALFTYAMSDEDVRYRRQAMLAAGVSRDPESVGRFDDFLRDSGKLRVEEGDVVALAATWGLVQLSGAGALASKQELLDADAPTARVLAILGLVNDGNRAALRQMAEMLAEPDEAPWVRAAAAYALGAAGARDSVEALRAAALSNHELLSKHALAALVRLGDGASRSALATGIVASADNTRATAIGIAAMLASGTYVPRAPVFDGVPERLTGEEIMAGMLPSVGSSEDRARALVTLRDELADAVQRSARVSTERAVWLADALVDEQGRPAFDLFTRDLDQVEAQLAARARDAADFVAQHAVGTFVELSKHPIGQVRSSALRFLATREESSAIEAVVDALRDDDPTVQEQALSVATRFPRTAYLPALEALLTAEVDWSTRVMAVRALRAAAEVPGVRGSDRMASVLERLQRLAVSDPYALVREAGVRALVQLAGPQVNPTLRQVADNDPEPRVRETAQDLLSSGTQP